MSYLPCDCSSIAVVSTIVGERCHVENDRGIWCAVVNSEGTYLQTLLVPSQQELTKEQIHQEIVLAEQAVQLAKEARKQELKAKMDSGETLSNQELSELLSMIM